MLEELYLNNLVIFENTSLPLESGLNVISGETGAGKSLIAGAIGLALGARANAEMIRATEEEATVSAIFKMPTTKNIIKQLKDAGIDTENEETLIFERRLSRSKSSRLSLCNRPVSASAMRDIADSLLDIAAQNEHTKLAQPNYQRELLDKFGKINTKKYTKLFSKATEIDKRLKAGDSQKELIRLELERIRYKLEKIADFAPDAAQDPVIEERISVLSNIEEIRSVAEEAVSEIYEAEDAVTSRLSAILKKTSALGDISPEMKQASEKITEAVLSLEDAIHACRDTGEGEEFSSCDLDALIARAEEMKNLVRILECEIDDSAPFEKIIVAQEILLNREEELSGWEIDTGAAKEEFARLVTELINEGELLFKERQKAGNKLSKKVNKELQDLGMPDANFSLMLEKSFSQSDAPAKILASISSLGIEEAQFMISPNPGEAPSTIAETASGGEASRTMLAIKSALAAVHSPPTLIFDEIDTGVGGRLGEVIAKKLHELAENMQIIVITHLPQIAAYADNHLKVKKTVTNGRTIASIKILNKNERIEEISHMIHGDAASEITRKQAKEMLAKK